MWGNVEFFLKGKYGFHILLFYPLMKSKPALLVFLLVLSCQGPWSYYPEDPENYAGIWTNAYIISGRPVENVCFDKMHALTEVRMPGFAFYHKNETSVRITGSFNGTETSVDLSPNPDKPNCFVGPSHLLADAGKNYEFSASIAWDSAGRKTTSNFYAKTYIPKKFKIKKAYDLTGKEFKEKETILYLPPPMDLKAAHFIPEYSDDVAIVQVTMVYNEDVYWGENSIDKLVEQFMDEEGADTARKAKFGDREHVWFARNQAIAGNKKEIDSIPIVGITMPAQGEFQLLFYATTNDYAKYRDTYLDNDDSRVKAIYNISGGAGIFAGMLVDTFQIQIEPVANIKLYPYFDAQKAYCRAESRDYSISRYRVRSECKEMWDSVIWCQIDNNGNPIDYGECLQNKLDDRPWNDIPPEEMLKYLNPSEIVTWCEHRNFPMHYPLCGPALISFSKGKSSLILEREAKKWCEENKNDADANRFMHYLQTSC
jgi:hypothetical protein